MGCGSGPFGDDAVDVFSGHYWRTIFDILADAEAVAQNQRGAQHTVERVLSNSNGLWFDLHAAL